MKKLTLLTLFTFALTLEIFSQSLPKLIPFRHGHKWGYVDSLKNVVIPFSFDDASPFLFNGHALVREKGKLVYINENGEKVKDVSALKEIEPNFFGLEKIKEEDGKFGVIDSLGNVIVPYQYDMILGFDGTGLAAVKKDKKCGFINDRGEVIIELKYDDVGVMWCNQLNRITLNKKEGYIDLHGNEYFVD